MGCLEQLMGLPGGKTGIHYSWEDGAGGESRQPQVQVP